jgi:diguanylate cyclase (GGDEF)-like protein
MIWFGGFKANGASDPLARFGLRARALPGKIRRAFDHLLAENAILASENADLLEKLTQAQALADRDPLAPVYNRRAFQRELHRVCSYIARYDSEAAVLFVDMDGFKGVNDSHGHAAGDAALVHVAQLLLANVRESDIVGRLGGDEFGIILVQANKEEARRKAEHLSRVIRDSVLKVDNTPCDLAASIGVHAFSAREGLGGPETLIARADEDMFLVKAAAKRRAAIEAA